jgi:hypothetical protein
MFTPLVSTTTRRVAAHSSSGISCRTPYSICVQQQQGMTGKLQLTVLAIKGRQNPATCWYGIDTVCSSLWPARWHIAPTWMLPLRVQVKRRGFLAQQTCTALRTPRLCAAQCSPTNSTNKMATASSQPVLPHI